MKRGNVKKNVLLLVSNEFHKTTLIVNGEVLKHVYHYQLSQDAGQIPVLTVKQWHTDPEGRLLVDHNQLVTRTRTYEGNITVSMVNTNESHP